MRSGVLFLLMLAATTSWPSGCSESPTLKEPSKGSGEGASSCTMVITGAMSATLPCTVIAGYAASSNQAVITISINTASAGISSAVVSTSTQGPFSTGTYTRSNLSVFASVVTGTNNGVWSVSKETQTGTLSVTITATGNSVSGSSGTSIYYPHGTASATLPAVQTTGAQGTVTLQATF
jgi:hypothetical protein